MNKTGTSTLDRAVAAIRELPGEAQEAMAHIIMEHAQGFVLPTRDPEHQALVEERLSKPLKFVSRKEFLATLRRFNPSI